MTTRTGLGIVFRHLALTGVEKRARSMPSMALETARVARSNPAASQRGKEGGSSPGCSFEGWDLASRLGPTPILAEYLSR